MGAATNSKAHTVKQVFTATLWILQNVGWCQKYYFRDKQDNPMSCAFRSGDQEPGRRTPENYQELGACDLMGALDTVEADPYLRVVAQNSLEQMIGASRSDPFPLNVWNDRPERTLADVVALLERAINETP